MDLSALIPLVLFGSFVLLLLLKVPISISLGISAAICLIILDIPLLVLPQRIFSQLDSFSFLAIPLFIVAGNLMSTGGISAKLIGVAESALGSTKGGLAIAAVVACAFFAALSGSGPATVVAIGGMIYPEMVKKGYPDYQMAGLLSVAGGLGPIIPPSLIMVLFCTITNTSIKGLFASGFLVGIMIMLAFIIVAFWQARRHNWPVSGEKPSVRRVLNEAWRSIWALLMPVIILGGIYSGIFTPTEAAAVAVLYAIIVSCFIYKTLNLKQLLSVFRESAINSSVVLFVIATSSIFSWLFSVAGISQTIVNVMLGTGLGYWGILIIMTVILMIFGFFLDFAATTLLLIPLFMPLCQAVGIPMLQLGMIVTIANSVGSYTPPVAVNLFAAATISHLPIGKIARGQMPYLLAMIVILILVIIFPGLSTFGG